MPSPGRPSSPSPGKGDTLNTDLYQSLTVALLAAITVLLIVAIATLARMRKTLESNGSLLGDVLTRSAGSRETAAGSSGAAAPTSKAPADGEDEARPEGVETGGDAGKRVGAVAASAGTEASRETDTGVLETASEQAAASEPADEPQEQPYERDGRWWYRRGEELLVYDEQTGQWLQVEGPSSRASGYADAAAQEQAGINPETRTGTIAGAGSSEELQAESAVGQSSSSFWKCSVCGAINGATASSCRMCFATRA